MTTSKIFNLYIFRNWSVTPYDESRNGYTYYSNVYTKDEIWSDTDEIEIIHRTRVVEQEYNRNI